jgi:cell division protein FtsA
MPAITLHTGLDIGSHSIKVAVLEQTETGLQVIGAADGLSQGIKRNSVVNIEDAVSSLSNVLEQVERMTGVAITSATVGVCGTHIKVMESSGVVAVSKANREISSDDVNRAIDAAEMVALPANYTNYTVLHVIPKEFIVDNQTIVKDPIGMTGVRLEVKTQIVLGLSSEINNITKSVYRTGVDIADAAFSILACAEATLDKRQKELGVALVNIGSSTTSLVVYEEGDVLHAAVLPIGSQYITNDLATGFLIDIDSAELIKTDIVNVDLEKVSKRDEFDLSKYMANAVDKKYYSLYEASEIASARQEEIFELVNKELKKINRSGLLPSGIVLTGGGAKINGAVELAKKTFKLPVFIGMPKQTNETPIDKVVDPTFTTAIGLALWAKDDGVSIKKNWSNGGQIGKTVDKIKGFFGSLIPNS